MYAPERHQQILETARAIGRVEVAGLTWRPYGRARPVLDGLDLTVAAGERVLLAGPSGSGKSTLLRALAGLLLTADDLAKTMRQDVREGLEATPKTLPPKWFYDAHGSELFEQITELPEYYPTRAEREILTARAGEIAGVLPARTLVELGSGFSEKTRLLLDALTGLEPRYGEALQGQRYAVGQEFKPHHDFFDTGQLY